MSKNITISDSKEGYTLDIDFDVQNDIWDNKFEELTDLTIKISKEVLRKAGLNKHIKNAEISVMLADNQAIQKLNLQYRGKDKATNILSFPAQDITLKQSDKLNFPNGFVMLGDIIFAYKIVEDEAQMQGKDFNNHFAHLLVHGILHLLGYDHQSDQEAMEMENIEVEILSTFNIKSPYETVN